jgi:DNA-binding LacI/PurR family transcriptional regulator
MLAAERGVRIIVGHAVGTRKEVDAYLDDFQARGVDAIISIFHNHPDYSRFVLPRLAQFERVVYFEQPAWDEADVPRKPDACYVAPDYYECQRLAVQHLIDRGRRRIALVMHNLVFPYAHARRRAHEETLKAAGQPFDERLVWIMDQQPSMRWTEPFTPERALLAVDELVLRQGADAIVAITDYYAARLVAAMRQRGVRIPDDVAIVGSDDFEIGTMIEPQLTTLDLRVDDLAQAVTEQLFGLLDHGVLPEDRRALVFAPRLVVRQST